MNPQPPRVEGSRREGFCAGAEAGNEREMEKETLILMGCRSSRSVRVIPKGDTRTLKGDTRTLKGDTRTLKGDTRTLKGDTRTLKGDTRTLM